jgi:hypothetical protein
MERSRRETGCGVMARRYVVARSAGAPSKELS